MIEGAELHSSSYVKGHFGEMLNKVQVEGTPVAITRQGRTIAYLIGANDWQALVSAVESLKAAVQHLRMTLQPTVKDQRALDDAEWLSRAVTAQAGSGVSE